MAIFLPIGYYLKKYQVIEKYGFKIGIAYCVLYCITYMMVILEIPLSNYLAAPSYTHCLVPNLSEVNGFLLIPSYLFYTTTGSILVFWISRMVNISKVLEYFGRMSLTIYCIHFTFLTLFANIFSSYIHHESLFGAGALFLTVAVFTLMASAIVAWIFERKPFSYFIGKF